MGSDAFARVTGYLGAHAHLTVETMGCGEDRSATDRLASVLSELSRLCEAMPTPAAARVDLDPPWSARYTSHAVFSRELRIAELGMCVVLTWWDPHTHELVTSLTKGQTGIRIRITRQDNSGPGVADEIEPGERTQLLLLRAALRTDLTTTAAELDQVLRRRGPQGGWQGTWAPRDGAPLELEVGASSTHLTAAQLADLRQCKAALSHAGSIEALIALVAAEPKRGGGGTIRKEVWHGQPTVLLPRAVAAVEQLSDWHGSGPARLAAQDVIESLATLEHVEPAPTLDPGLGSGSGFVVEHPFDTGCLSVAIRW